ncbi:uncharacterized protein PHALS_09761 [Plasmopara halstedii]|uniref:Uncharacterized protein n=1 Tax=Plasmopara halstedii TaxID=4781 RepID=A0A0P1AEQ5_PLAHL|nr:uncharacterized protein PHALS_09761 [Plasmopara halstedii]CEG39519.1 hypothetical protein PHALS_09761 [Plasmopara halstedii]|eukprot:XP_024575888.1 hypothetical protein PHALS_09761 [Plasmopara halstedii]
MEQESTKSRNGLGVEHCIPKGAIMSHEPILEATMTLSDFFLLISSVDLMSYTEAIAAS